MSETTANNTAEQAASSEHTLTACEQKIMGLLLDGIVPKEIALNLNISYNTVLYHQKNLYRKLEVQSIQELLVKILAQSRYELTLERETEPQVIADYYFARIIKTNDELGSKISYKVDDEIIGEQNKRTYTFFGHLVSRYRCYATIFMIPNSSILDTMKKIKRFSFSAMGDGNSYGVMLLTSDTMIKGEYNNYHKIFTAEKGVVSEYNVNLDELVQHKTWGKQVPFIRSNILEFGFFPHSKGDFELKVWDIKFIE
jgi:DNA-binding CsgD family transcriptional regulator